MSFLRFVSYAGGALGIAAFFWSGVHVLMPPPPQDDSRILWAILGVLNFAPAGGVLVADALPKFPKNRAAALFMGWAASSAAVLLLDGLVALFGRPS